MGSDQSFGKKLQQFHDNYDAITTLRGGFTKGFLRETLVTEKINTNIPVSFEDPLSQLSLQCSHSGQFCRLGGRLKNTLSIVDSNNIHLC